jgi:hypothetical protein
MHWLGLEYAVPALLVQLQIQYCPNNASACSAVFDAAPGKGNSLLGLPAPCAKLIAISSSSQFPVLLHCESPLLLITKCSVFTRKLPLYWIDLFTCLMPCQEHTQHFKVWRFKDSEMTSELEGKWEGIKMLSGQNV